MTHGPTSWATRSSTIDGSYKHQNCEYDENRRECRSTMMHRLMLSRLSQSFFSFHLPRRTSSSACSSPNSKLFQLQNHTLLALNASPLTISRSYGTAEAAVSVASEVSDRVEDEGLVEAKTQELSSLKMSLEELNQEILKLKKLQKKRQAVLAKLKKDEEKSLEKSSPLNENEQISGPSDAIAVEQESDIVANLRYGHPWPEWTAFLKHLENNGYFNDDGKGFPGREISLEEESPIKHAVLSFGRDRDDIFSLLSRKDLKVIASFGCPNTERKSVNGAKRLRALCNIEEGNVCQQCRLKKSCERAFVQPPSDVSAETLDVIRLLFSYALNALPSAQSHESYPEDLTNSICYLLKQLTLLTVNPRDPALPKPARSLVKEKPDPKEAVPKADDNASYGNWTCPNCDFSNFARNRQCRDCGVYRPATDPRPGDWECPNPTCRFSNFARNTACIQCETDRPLILDIKPGDWQCPNSSCGFYNFARNTVCLKCETKRPLHVENSREESFKGSRKVSFEEDTRDERGHVDRRPTPRPHSRWEDEDSRPSRRGSGESYKGSRKANFKDEWGRADEDEWESVDSQTPRSHARWDSKPSRGGSGEIYKGSRKISSEEDFKDDGGRLDRRTPRSHSRWEDNKSLQGGSKLMSSVSRGGIQSSRHDEWKPNLRKQKGKYHDLDESEQDESCSDICSESDEEENYAQSSKGAKKSKHPQKRRQFDMVDDDDDDKGGYWETANRKTSKYGSRGGR